MVFDPLPDDTDIKPLRDWDGSIMQPLEPVERAVDGPTRLQELSADVRDHLILIGCGILAVIGVLLWANADRPAPPTPVAEASVRAPLLPTDPIVVARTEAVDTITPAPEPTPTPTPTPTPPPTPRATASDPPTPSPQAAAPLGQTVLFRGGPASGPWQQIGSVAEITHPDAAASARASYERFSADLSPSVQVAALWDQLVAELASTASTLGPPADRPTFGASEDEQSPLSAFGRVLDVYPADGALTAYFVVAWLDGSEAVRTHRAYLIDDGGRIIERIPTFDLRAFDIRTAEAADEEARTRIRAWARLFGYNQPEATAVG